MPNVVVLNVVAPRLKDVHMDIRRQREDNLYNHRPRKVGGSFEIKFRLKIGRIIS
jgi:hypothetical protein